MQACKGGRLRSKELNLSRYCPLLMNPFTSFLLYYSLWPFRRRKRVGGGHTSRDSNTNPPFHSSSVSLVLHSHETIVIVKIVNIRNFICHEVSFLCSANYCAMCAGRSMNFIIFYLILLYCTYFKQQKITRAQMVEIRETEEKLTRITSRIRPWGGTQNQRYKIIG